jgi:ribosomal protein L11 methylase PrmA
MQSILLRYEPCDRESLVTELWEHGTVGILEEVRGLRAFFEDGAALQFFSGRMIEIRAEVPPDPSDFAKRDWDPIFVGKRFWIAPSWVDQPTAPGRIRLAIDSPNAFGTGRHESTQLALEALEEHVTTSDVVLDIGSGSGILSQAALLLGAGEVFSCDIHDDAIASSQAQLRSRLFQGSADALRSQTGDVVLANISTKVIDALSWELNRITKPNGLLILTGFIRENPPKDFSPERITERGDWLCWLCRPEAVGAGKRLASHSHSLEWW